MAPPRAWLLPLGLALLATPAGAPSMAAEHPVDMVGDDPCIVGIVGFVEGLAGPLPPALAGPGQGLPLYCRFEPAVVHVRAGDTVTWTNRALATPHTATALDASFDTGVVNPGGSAAVVFAAPGSFDYFCQIHESSMATGRVVVEA